MQANPGCVGCWTGIATCACWAPTRGHTEMCGRRDRGSFRSGDHTGRDGTDAPMRNMPDSVGERREDADPDRRLGLRAGRRRQAEPPTAVPQVLSVASFEKMPDPDW